MRSTAKSRRSCATPSPTQRPVLRHRRKQRRRTCTRHQSWAMTELKYAEAIRAALAAELAADESVVVLGEEVGALGGVFTVTQTLQETFGADRVLDSPICENALVGWAIGAAVDGMRPVVEVM